MFYRERDTRRVRSVPACWTDVAGVDPCVALAAGRSRFRVEDLLLLVHLLSQGDGGGEGRLRPSRPRMADELLDL